MKCLFLLLMLMLVVVCGVVNVEKVDFIKFINIEVDQMVYDDVCQVKIFIGNVVMICGMLIIKVGCVVLMIDQYGYENVVLYVVLGVLVNFCQKCDGGFNLWIEGQVECIEYLEQIEIFKLFQCVYIQCMDGDCIIDEVNGEFIFYDSCVEFYFVNNIVIGESKLGVGCIIVVIQFKNLLLVGSIVLVILLVQFVGKNNVVQFVMCCDSGKDQ